MQTQSPFLEVWNLCMIIGAIIMTAAGIAIYLLHKLKISTIKDYKAKYDYINQKEIKNYKKVFLCFAVAAMLLINLYSMGKLHCRSMVLCATLYVDSWRYACGICCRTCIRLLLPDCIEW
jgi:hypothetical protein